MILRLSLKWKLSFFVCIAIILFPICNLVEGLGYYDEIMGLIGFFVTFVLLFKGKIDGAVKYVYIILTIITIIGLVSNKFNGLMTQTKPVLIDILALWKVYTVFMLFSFLAEYTKPKSVIKGMQVISKLTLIFTAVVSVVGFFVDIGVYIVNEVFDEHKFGFFWKNGIQTGWLIFGCLVFIAASENNNSKTILIYSSIASVPMLLTQSSLVWCWLFVYIALIFFLKEKNKFKVRYLILLVAGIAFFSAADIMTYTEYDSVRMKFWRYALKTANTYFPFGSGFATYGTDMAAKYYSQLYVKYGWENTWAFGKGSQFLNDSFFSGIFGQFGWIGFALYLIIILIIFKNYNTVLFKKPLRSMCIATVVTIAMVMIASASAKSMMGAFMFAILGVINAYKKEIRKSIKKDTQKRSKGK